MRTILAETIEKAVAKLSMDACYFLGEDVYCALKHSIEREKSPTGRDILGQLVQNAEIARKKKWRSARTAAWQ